MIKVVIISYFFPPSNFVGGERTAAWAKHLNESGIYPIVITRIWNENQKDLVDPLNANKLIIEKTDQYEIRRLPYKRSLRDKLSSYPSLRILQKAFTIKELIFSNFFLSSLPYSNFYTEAKKELDKGDVKAVIASGRPFQSFAIGHALKKKYDILWIPDYRDEWTSHIHLKSQGKLLQWIGKLERRSEKKWTSNADFFLTVSDEWSKNISALILKQGRVVYNGYNQLVKDPIRNVDAKHFVITYAGTLYNSQNIGIFLEAAINLIKEGHPLHIRFIGVEMNSQETNRIESMTIGMESHFSFLKRMPKSDLEDYLNQSDLLFLTSFDGIKGWYPVKLFEYYASGIPFILCPSDEDCMEQFVKLTNSGFVTNSVEECQQILMDCIQEKNKKGKVAIERNFEEGEKYSRQHQTKVLSEIMKEAMPSN